jgi:hypothetical protein
MNKDSMYSNVMLDLGDVYEIADVWINRVRAGAKICPPYHFDITSLISQGQNSLRIDVVNTLAPKLGDNIFDRSMPQEPAGLIGSVIVKSSG